MKAHKIAGCNKADCPTIYITDVGTALAQGTPVDDVDGVALGPGEIAVQLPLQVLKDAVAALEEGRGAE
ncbi:hypothetical protein NLX83_04025 [Allokutzneria sp. A3M-2-11 16]|uniref:hypothetical protein n=1 Tax=Allokutzneria sp. A3M-2-11 16 TaxID=2962043 RepID=UPI0020B7739F|nr:hypothetical protein [Allokutzneria sp. A3M-2-11 16]MCP3798421.1 hypothetical protein [Allokutzneria sp. A3M-2-11 16]